MTDEVIEPAGAQVFPLVKSLRWAGPLSPARESERWMAQGVLEKRTLLFPVTLQSSAALQSFQAVAVRHLLSLAALLSLPHAFCRRKEREVSGSTTRIP